MILTFLILHSLSHTQLVGFAISLTGLYLYRQYKNDPAKMSEYLYSGACCCSAEVLLSSGSGSAGGTSGTSVTNSTGHNATSVSAKQASAAVTKKHGGSKSPRERRSIENSSSCATPPGGYNDANAGDAIGSSGIASATAKAAQSASVVGVLPDTKTASYDTLEAADVAERRPLLLSAAEEGTAGEEGK